ncbi:hypothetical protein [Streptomyces sp. IMTB 2501]|uniref:hypothetical protein n=1 Tax=Streptomyces sp. IMTB 2501 TaxID=1776340 RepID=UPI002116AFDE|nr:hypothetical protein [Streptomyces sp. IMTB 2501]
MTGPAACRTGSEDALVVQREQGLLHVRRAVRDQHHRPAAHLPRRRGDRDSFIGKLFAHPLKDPLGDSEFVPLGPHLCQLLGQPFFEFIQFRAPRGDPFQQLGIHAPDRRWQPRPNELEPANRPAPSDDLHRTCLNFTLLPRSQPN